MVTVAELFDFFLSACKANYWPEGCIAPDEAVKIYMALLAKEWEDMYCIFQTQAGVSSPRTLLKNKTCNKGQSFF